MSSSFNEIGPSDSLAFEQGAQEVKSMLASGETILGSCESFISLPVSTHFGFIAITNTRVLFASVPKKRFGPTVTAVFPLEDIIAPVWLGKDESIPHCASLSFTFSGITHRFMFLGFAPRLAWGEDFKNRFIAAVQQASETSKSAEKSPSAVNTGAVLGVQIKKPEPKNEVKLEDFATAIKLGVALVVVISLLIFGFNVYQNRQQNQAVEDLRVLVFDTCRDFEQATDEQSIDSLYDQYWEEMREIDLKTDDVVRRLKDSAIDCLNDARDKFAPVTVPEPPKKSDAELAAEGKSCSRQWRSAHAETLSGGASDVQLRATLYACDTLEDWITEALINGEYSDYLLPVLCGSEKNAPYALCN